LAAQNPAGEAGFARDSAETGLHNAKKEVAVKLACQEGMVPGKTLQEKFRNLERWGYEGMEFWGSALRTDSEKVKEIKRLAGNSKVKACTICAGYRGCLLDGQKSEREQALGDIRELLGIGRELGVVGLIMVPVFGPPRVPDLSPYASHRDLEGKLLVALLSEMGDHAAKTKCTILVEPLNRYETHFLNRLEQAVAIVKKVKNPYVKIMADFFHMSIEEADVAKSIKRAGDWIQHIHLADSNRVLPGMGHTDFAAPFQALKDIGYDKYMAMECGVPGDASVELPKSAAYLRQWI
jgi:sugar phosphate isomerase/epimerase